jgi:hypothetical protein
MRIEVTIGCETLSYYCLDTNQCEQGLRDAPP